MAKFLPLLLIPTFAFAQSATNMPARILELKIPAGISANGEANRVGIPGITTLRATVALPEGFDPRKVWPVLIVTAPSGASAVQSLSIYTNVALAQGWVVAAVDGPKVYFEKDNNVFAWAMISSLLDQLRISWPQSKQWPFACAGFSGGAKRAVMTAANMMRQRDNVIGVFMGGCDADRATLGYEISWPGPKFFDVPMFISSGTRDPIAGPAKAESVRQSMVQTGFRKIRLEIYDGEHRLDTNQLRLALEWFRPRPKRAPGILPGAR
jgi:predicted esterase